jgi:hypothetical protein
VKEVLAILFLICVGFGIALFVGFNMPIVRQEVHGINDRPFRATVCLPGLVCVG